MDLIVRVRAVGDSSLTSVFRPLLAASAAASKQVEAQLAGAGRGAARAAAEGAAAHRAAASSQASGIRAIQALRNADHREFLANLRVEESEAKRTAKAIAAEQKKAAREAAAEQKQVYEKASAAARTFGSLARTGLSTLGRVASEGFGVDVNPFAAMGRARETRDIAGRATRSAFSARGEIATTADVDATVKAIQGGGDRAKLGYAAMAEGLEDFVAKSSDLKTGNAVLARMGVIAQATGANVKDLLSAGGDVNRELDDSPDRAERLLAIMRLVAKQGAMGNVEVKDLARYMGRVQSTAFMYEGSKDKNIGILGALAQVSMKGGQSSAAEATRSAAAFARDITKSKALERFESAGINVFSDSSKTAVRSPEAIITEFLRKSKGNFADLAKLFQNQSSRAVVLGFENIYKQAGGGEKGLAAVQNEFKRFSTTMSQTEMEAQAKTALEGDTASAQQFKNDMEKIGAEMAHELGPALKELAPIAKDAARALAGIVSFGAQNPGLAITAAIVASIGKAALGEAVGKAMGAALVGMGGKGAAIGALAIAATAVYLQTKKVFDEGAEGQNKGLGTQLAATNAAMQIQRDIAAGRISKEEGFKKLEEAYKSGSKDVQNAEKDVGYLSALNPFSSVTGEEAGRAQLLRDGENGAKVGGMSSLEALKADLAAMKTAMDRLATEIKADSGKVRDVNVVGGLPGAGPTPNEGARSGGVN